METILCLSGGIDSTCAYHLHKPDKTIFFDTGGYAAIEKDVVLAMAPDTIIDTSLNFVDILCDRSAYIPYRNLLFAARAAQYLPNGGTVMMAGLKDDLVSDKNPDAFDSMRMCLNLLDSRYIEVVSPFWEMTKAQVIGQYIKEGFPEHDLLATFSCYDPQNGIECHACPACFRKWNALWENGIKNRFFNMELMAEYNLSACYGKYDRDRNQSIIQSVKEYMSWIYSFESKVFCFDIDGVLTKETEGHDYEKRTPQFNNISIVIDLFEKGHTIILNTARWQEDMQVTNKWLRKHHVLYHKIQFGKPKADFYIDDKMISLGEVLPYAQ